MFRQLGKRLCGLLPAPWWERLQRWRAQMAFLRAHHNVRQFLRKKLVTYVERLLNQHCYNQEIYGKAPLLSLLVACDSDDVDNGFLPALISSLKKQTWPYFEVIFLPGNGKCRFKQKLAAMIAQKGCSSWVILAPDSSCSRSFNQALGIAQGKYIVSLKSCDILDPTFLEESLLLLEASPPHFFIQSVNQPFAQKDDWPVFNPGALLKEDKFRVLVFPRSAGLALQGYDESIASGFAGWEFYVKLIRYGYVGRSLSCRIDCGWAAASESAKSHRAGFVLAKQRIQTLHLGYILNHKRWLRYRAWQYWLVTNPLCNLLPLAEAGQKKAYWLDLAANPGVSVSGLARLMARFDDFDIPLIVTIDSRWQAFFRYNKKEGIQVYQPDQYHLQGDIDYFYRYLQAFYRLEQVFPEDFLRQLELNLADRQKLDKCTGKLRILYVAPWLITGGADTMTVDWFRQLDSSWSEKFFVTTLFNRNNWLPKIANYAQGIYDLPASGCMDVIEMIDFLVEFIALQRIDVLHIMNSETAFQALPRLKECFPDLKVVAQFHCFDYLADGQRAGYALTMPPRYNHFIDLYNIEYPQLGDDIVALNPDMDRHKFVVIYGRVDTDYYNLEVRRPCPQIAVHQQVDVLNLLFIGRLDRQKQPLRLLEIAAELRDQQIPFVMHVIGDGNLESQKNEFLSELQRQELAGQVFYYGEQPLETLVDWYLIADILLLTSDWEGVPMVLYQAMAMQVVPVVSDVGGCAELVTSACGYLISEQDNIENYVTAIKELRDDKRRQKMGAAARQRMVDYFSLASLDAEYRIFYESLF